MEERLLLSGFNSSLRPNIPPDLVPIAQVGTLCPTSFTANGYSNASFSYRTAGNFTAPASVDFYRSVDTVLDSADIWLDAVLLDVASLSAGDHTKTLPIGPGAQLELPTTDGDPIDGPRLRDYYLLATSSLALNCVPAQFVGAYKPVGLSTVFVHGRDTGDTIAVSNGGSRLSFNGTVYDYTASLVQGYSIRSHAGNDTVTASGVSRPIRGLGGPGNDTIRGGTANDALDGGLDNDSLRGGSGNDLIFGGGGADTVLGEAGDDRVFGGIDSDGFPENDDAADSVVGGAGTDAGHQGGYVLNGIAQGVDIVTEVEDFPYAPVGRVQVYLRTGNVSHAGTDGTIEVRLNSQNLTRIDSPADDFLPNTTRMYDLVTDHVSILNDITQLRIHNTSDDGWCMKEVRLRVNGVGFIYQQTIGTATNSTCLWLDGDGATDTLTINSATLRGSAAWRAFSPPVLAVPFVITEPELHWRIEARVGDKISGTDFYWGSGVAVTRKDDHTVRVTADLGKHVAYLPEAYESFNLGFDLVFSCSTDIAGSVLSVTATNFDHIDASSFGGVLASFNLPLCPSITVDSGANVVFSL